MTKTESHISIISFLEFNGIEYYSNLKTEPLPED